MLGPGAAGGRGELQSGITFSFYFDILFLTFTKQDEVYGASGVLGMASVDSEQDSITWQVRTRGILTFYSKTSLIWNRNICTFTVFGKLFADLSRTHVLWSRRMC